VQLLVSVRDAIEAAVALEAGAHIVDAKEPDRGPLAAVDPEVLAAITQRLPASTPISAALGEPADVGALEQALACRCAALLHHPAYVKFVIPALAPDVLAACVAATRAAVPHARVVLATYADRSEAPLVEVARLVGTAGADGVLVDTASKGRSLLDIVPAAVLEAFVGMGHASGLFVALAGSLSAEDLPRVAALGADVAGVRGAACDGGRNARLSGLRVRALRLVVERGPRARAALSS